MFEHHRQRVLPLHVFLVRLAKSTAIGALLILVSLLIGMLGYHWLEALGWIDSFLNASMLLGGMGPVNAPTTEGGKLFAGFYALYCGLVVILVAGIIFAPLAHRFLHKFHLDMEDKQ